MDKKRVVVAMSGGVDSSVAAALLKQGGYDVIGMMLRLWSEPGKQSFNRCCTPDAMAQARRVAAILEIPFYAVDAQDVFHDTVVAYFYDGYRRGDTPNPCLECNRTIRWEFLLNRARALGADYMATGHYVRLEGDPNEGLRLLKAVDAGKDQSYVLHVLDQARLRQALFPLGGYTKDEVRQMAADFGLPVASRADSQDLCFLAGNDYRDFLRRNAPDIAAPGPILDSGGRQIGSHQGLAYYTIGQRKGLGISNNTPLYVLEKDTQRNALIIGASGELGRQRLTTGPVNWIAGETPGEPFRAEVKIRYRAQPYPALVEPLENDAMQVTFDQALRDITPGQAAVVYDGEICLGGGVIQSVGGKT
jgi:tRNA-specific 2-thiouridylase